jgi:hypothetical protein
LCGGRTGYHVLEGQTSGYTEHLTRKNNETRILKPYRAFRQLPDTKHSLFLEFTTLNLFKTLAVDYVSAERFKREEFN